MEVCSDELMAARATSRETSVLTDRGGFRSLDSFTL